METQGMEEWSWSLFVKKQSRIQSLMSVEQRAAAIVHEQHMKTHDHAVDIISMHLAALAGNQVAAKSADPLVPNIASISQPSLLLLVSQPLHLRPVVSTHLTTSPFAPCSSSHEDGTCNRKATFQVEWQLRHTTPLPSAFPAE